MSESILDSVKKILGLGSDYTPFDVDVIIHINSVFTTLNQLGIGPTNGFMIMDNSTLWDEYLGGDNNLNSVKSYMFLRVKLLFDAPTMSFVLTAYENQIKELEWRLNVHREEKLWNETNSPDNTSTADLTVVRGNTLEFTLRAKEGTVLGWTGLFTAKQQLDNDPTDANALTASAIAEETTITFRIPTTVDTPVGWWFWDVKLTPPGQDPVTVPTQVGSLYISRPVTNRS